MKIHSALIKRITELARERGKTPVEIGKLGGIGQSTISELLRGATAHPKVVTIQKYCNGLGITLEEFFASDLFNNTDEFNERFDPSNKKK